MIPIAGSAYTYSYATLGEIFAWIIGWDLILEYAFSNMSVAVGFSAYFNDILDNLFGFHLPKQLSQPIFEEGQRTGAWFNLSAFVVLMLLTCVLVRGVRESAETNNAMVLVKLVAILFFVFGAAKAVNTGNWHPFMPNGYSGVLDRRRDRLLHLHWIRFGIYRGGGVSVARSVICRSEFSRRLAICAVLYGSVALGADRHRALGHAEQRCAGGQRAQSNRHEPAAADRHRRRAGRYVVVAAGFPIWPGARLVRDVARPAAAGRFFAHPSQIQDAVYQHLGGGIPGRDPAQAYSMSVGSPIFRISERCSLSFWFRPA